MMSYNCYVICVDDDIFHTGIFLTHFNYHFYAHFDHGHVFGPTKVY